MTTNQSSETNRQTWKSEPARVQQASLRVSYMNLEKTDRPQATTNTRYILLKYLTGYAILPTSTSQNFLRSSPCDSSGIKTQGYLVPPPSPPPRPSSNNHPLTLTTTLIPAAATPLYGPRPPIPLQYHPPPLVGLASVGKRRRKTRLTLRELDHQGTVFFSLFMFWRYNRDGGRVRSCCAERAT